jgi:hypothetical protein
VSVDDIRVREFLADSLALWRMIPVAVITGFLGSGKTTLPGRRSG